MNLDEAIPLKYYTNLGTAEEARKRFLNSCFDQDVHVARMAGIAPEWVQRVPRGHSRQSYAESLTFRLGLREARRRGAPAVLIFSDEVVLEAYFREQVELMEVPSDWGVLLLGGSGDGSATSGWLSVKEFGCWHAVAVKRAHYAEVMRLLRRSPRDRGAWAVGSLCSVPAGIKAYLVRPRLVWTIDQIETK